MDKPKPITELLSNTSFAAEQTLRHGEYLRRLNTLLTRILDGDSRLHCQIGNIRDGLLILFADSTAWAVRLRYQTPVLLRELKQQKGLESLQKIEIRVMPKEEKEHTEQKVSLSSEASSCINACADNISDEKLQNALKRLAAHHKKEID